MKYPMTFRDLYPLQSFILSGGDSKIFYALVSKTSNKDLVISLAIDETWKRQIIASELFARMYPFTFSDYKLFFTEESNFSLGPLIDFTELYFPKYQLTNDQKIDLLMEALQISFFQRETIVYLINSINWSLPNARSYPLNFLTEETNPERASILLPYLFKWTEQGQTSYDLLVNGIVPRTEDRQMKRFYLAYATFIQ
jgi:hypothetical protein